MTEEPGQKVGPAACQEPEKNYRTFTELMEDEARGKQISVPEYKTFARNLERKNGGGSNGN